MHPYAFTKISKRKLIYFELKYDDNKNHNRVLLM